jgi:NAD(P)-dependent dehydrogenase (short-subunit alcohol dehydrogenase family)
MMNNKVVLITGATNGIGRVAALELAKMGARVVIVGRSREKTEAVRQEIQAAGGSADSLLADLSALDEIRRLAAEFRARYDRLDVLLNNAGAIFARRQTTADGFEMTFALNHLSYFLLTNLLLDVLKASAPARIINVSSDAHRSAQMNFDDLQHEKSCGMGGFQAYGRSKLANVLFTYELARRLAGTGISANALHPGFVATGFGRNMPGLMNRVMGIMHRFALTPEQGAQTLIYLASSPEVEGMTGKYFDKNRPMRSSPASYDEAAQKRLWDISERLAGLQPASV